MTRQIPTLKDVRTAEARETFERIVPSWVWGAFLAKRNRDHRTELLLARLGALWI